MGFPFVVLVVDPSSVVFDVPGSASCRGGRSIVGWGGVGRGWAGWGWVCRYRVGRSRVSWSRAGWSRVDWSRVSCSRGGWSRVVFLCLGRVVRILR